MEKEHINPDGMHRPRGYTHTVRAGNTVYVAGQVGWDKDGKIVSGGFEAQAAQAFENLKRALEGGGASLADVVKITTYVKDLNDLPKFREVREKYFTAPLPASTLVQIVSLAMPELLIEIEAIAVVEGS